MLNTVYTPQIGRRQQPRGLCLVYPSARRAQVALCHLCWHIEQDHVFSKVKDAWAQPPSPTICNRQGCLGVVPAGAHCRGSRGH